MPLLNLLTSFNLFSSSSTTGSSSASAPSSQPKTRGGGFFGSLFGAGETPSSEAKSPTIRRIEAKATIREKPKVFATHAVVYSKEIKALLELIYADLVDNSQNPYRDLSTGAKELQKSHEWDILCQSKNTLAGSHIPNSVHMLLVCAYSYEKFKKEESPFIERPQWSKSWETDFDRDGFKEFIINIDKKYAIIVEDFLASRHSYDVKSSEKDNKKHTVILGGCPYRFCYNDDTPEIQGPAWLKPKQK